jgi:hypothetical protein
MLAPECSQITAPSALAFPISVPAVSFISKAPEVEYGDQQANFHRVENVSVNGSNCALKQKCQRQTYLHIFGSYFFSNYQTFNAIIVLM